ncbi:MAG: hypothetical protein U9N02_00650 [Campylobacterota bacterium]|nr:hypothetical protein [Campylobacterota bacterium]
MIKILLLSLTALFFSGCVNKHGVSLKYYSECEEYYDLQGYYHKECGKDDVITYKEMEQNAIDIKNIILPKKIVPVNKNVW